jgi:hypothetical protein
MKRFVFVFLVLGWTVAAHAQTDAVLVYDMKASNAGFGYVEDTNKWTQIKDTNTAFVIVEMITDETANVRAVYTWKGKDKKNYAMDVNMGRATMGGSDKIGFLVDANTHTGTRIQLSGNNKQITIGKKTSRSCLGIGCHNTGSLPSEDLQLDGCPQSLTGYRIKNTTDADGNKKIYTSTLSAKLDIAKTLATHHTVDCAEDEADTLLSALYDAGYIIVEE